MEEVDFDLQQIMTKAQYSWKGGVRLKTHRKQTKRLAKSNLEKESGRRVLRT